MIARLNEFYRLTFYLEAHLALVLTGLTVLLLCVVVDKLTTGGFDILFHKRFRSWLQVHYAQLDKIVTTLRLFHHFLRLIVAVILFLIVFFLLHKPEEDPMIRKLVYVITKCLGT